MKIDKNVKFAFEAHKKSGLEIIKAVKDAYPVGSILYVSIGRSTFPVEVKSHNELWWSNPGEMTGKNLKTGKSRRFTPYHLETS